MNNTDRQSVHTALTIAAELTATHFSAASQEALLDDLAAYDTQAVLQALQRCRRELDGPLTLAAILARIDSGRRNAAWRAKPRNSKKAAGYGGWRAVKTAAAATVRFFPEPAAHWAGAVLQ